MPWRRTGLVVGVGLGMAACALSPAPDPRSAEQHNDLGVAYFARGQYELAAREFGRAAARAPTWTRPLINLGDAELGRGETARAITAYEAARRLAPDDPAIANNLAWALLSDPSRHAEAESMMRAVLLTQPEPRGYYLDTLGAVLLRRGRPRDALEAFRAALQDQALRDPPTRALVLRHAGQALAALGDAGAASRCEALAKAWEGVADNVGAEQPVC
jgi:Flp pilus assembly protein TadD